MKTRPRRQRSPYLVIGQLTVNPNWTGMWIVLNPGDNANMPQAPNGSMVLVYMNTAKINTMGQLAVTSGGGAPIFLNAQSLQNQPSILTQNFGGPTGNNLSVTNTSIPGSNNPIKVSAYAPGIPGQSCVPLKPNDPNPVPLATGQCTQGTALPRYMQLTVQATSGSLAIFALIGGPMDSGGNNAYVISVNDSVNGNTGPGTGNVPPPGYYATTSSNAYPYSFNWGSSNVYVANMSPATTSGVKVSLRSL
jgi:hypothetical protein